MLGNANQTTRRRSVNQGVRADIPNPNTIAVCTARAWKSEPRRECRGKSNRHNTAAQQASRGLRAQATHNSGIST